MRRNLYRRTSEVLKMWCLGMNNDPVKGWVWVSALLLAGCGVEAVGSAATGAAVKKQELEQGQAQKEAIQQRLDQAIQQGQQRQEALEQATK